MHADVFVSYSQPDRTAAFEIVSQLEAHGIKVWIAPRDIAPSAEWAAEIIEAIGASKIMVLVFSAASNSSPQVRREVERAVHRQVPILPVRIEDVLPTKSMEYFLSAQHWLDAFPPPLTVHCERLCRQIIALLTASPAPRTDAPDAAPRMAAAPAPRTPFTNEELGSLQKRLAHHVGPIAGYLVRRAAARAASWAELTAQLAAEIDTLPARQAFLEACRAGVGSSPSARP
jgi:hypothetical protein